MCTEATAGIGYKWKPIEPLNSVGSSYDFSEIDSLQRQWLIFVGVERRPIRTHIRRF